MGDKPSAVFVLIIAVVAAVELPCGFASAGESEAVRTPVSEPAFHVVRVEIADPAEIEFLDRWIDIWDADPERGMVEAAVDAEGFEILREFGFHFKVDEKKTEKYNRPLVR